MNILLVHQNFPGQFKHIAPALGAQGRHRVVSFGMKASAPIPGVQAVHYRPGKGSTPAIHPWALDFESKMIRGDVAFKAALKMRDEHGFVPDLIFAHHGWGEPIFLKEVWPRAKLLLYCEWYYPLQGADVCFDAEFQAPDPRAICRMRAKNAHNLMAYELADAGVSPTHWQADTHPAWFRPRIQVIHDGVDTTVVKPALERRPLRLPIPADEGAGIPAGEVTLQPDDEIISFVNRNLEPYRGYHVFIRAVPELLRRRPRAHIVIVGGNSVSYGAPCPEGSWKQRFLAEVRDDIDWRRVHFVGNIPYASFLQLLQLTTVHTYLTYPFVLSWSLIEAMACEGAIVASDTEPVREVITDGETGRLVPFFDRGAMVDRICELLDDAPQRQRLGQAARALAVARYDLHSRCLPAMLRYMGEVARG